MNEVRQLLERAQEILETGGWQQGDHGPYDNPRVPHCAEGALWCALAERSDAFRVDMLRRTAFLGDSEAWEAWSLLQKASMVRGYAGVFALNDDIGTTAEDMISLLKETAASVPTSAEVPFA